MDLENEVTKYLEYCEVQKHLNAHTIKAYKIDLNQFLRYISYEKNLRDNLNEYVRILHNKYKVKTIRRKIATLKAFVRYLYCNDIIQNNPFDKINTRFCEPILLPRTIPEHILKSLFKKAYLNIKLFDEEKYALRDASVLEMLFATGARVSEVCSLKVEDIDLKTQTVRFFGKGAKERIIEIENKDVLSTLKKYEEKFLPDINKCGYFFINNRKQKLSEQSARSIIKKLAKQVDSSMNITPHMFRHSMATMLLEEDVDIRYIQRILGHSSITTTQIYTHVTSLKQKEILRNKHPRNRVHM